MRMSKVNIEINSNYKEEKFLKVYKGDYVLLQIQDDEPELYVYDYSNRMKRVADITDGVTIPNEDIYVNDIVYDKYQRRIKVLGICDIKINVCKVKKYRD
jgi:hypothetical protein